MKERLLILAVALTLGASCADRPISQMSNPRMNTPTPETAKPTSQVNSAGVSKESEKKSVPSEFSGIDFRNISYPISSKPGTVRLKDGRVEFFEDEDLGNAWFDFDRVDYVDLIGNGK